MGRQVKPGIDDMATTHPELAAQWHPTKNGDILPASVMAGSGNQRWWLCAKGHAFEMTPNARSTKGAGCPVCSGRRVAPGINDLATTNPELAAQWHPTKNGALTPRDVVAGTSKRIWWICEKGHEWAAESFNRLVGTGCPVCAGKQVRSGVNDMATTNPELAAQWHPTKNGDLTPRDVVAGTNKVVWWRCSRGHDFRNSGNGRMGGSNCPVCSNQAVEVGVNDMATTNPELAAQWHPTKNGALTPRDVVAGTSKRIWWVCEKAHPYAATGSSQLRGRGCPVCAGKSVLPGVNDMATTSPELAAQWHPAKNGALTPREVVAGTSKRIWWMCDKGHEWFVSPSSRATGTGCPVCDGKQVISGFNDMATTNPELAAQWHPTKNGALTPRDVVAGTNKRIWWMCDKGHEWVQSGGTRKGGTGCPVCLNQVVETGVNDLATTNPELAAQWHPTKNGALTPQAVVAGTTTKIWWQCEHGHVWNAAGYTRRVSGCPTCASTGFDPGKPAILYFIANKGLAARKVGITNVGTTRLAAFTKAGWHQVFIVERPSGIEVAAVETAMFQWIRKELRIPQYLAAEAMKRTGGATETFGEDGPSDYEIIQRIKAEFDRRREQE